MVPTTRATFKEYCLRELGKPVIEINVDDDQVDDRIDAALKYYYDYHFDGSEKVYYKHVITELDQTNQYITLPENIIGAVRIFDINGGTMAGSQDMFNINYQIALNDLYSLTTISMIPYYMTMMNLSLIKELITGQQPIRYNRHTNILKVDMKWEKIPVGHYLIVEAYQVVDPDVYTDAWGDRWLAKYGTALIKKQWGNNMKKFDNMTLPGGVKMNGQRIYDEAVKEIAALEEEMIYTYSLPATDMVG